MLDKEIECHSFTPIKRFTFVVIKILIIGLYWIVILQVLSFNFQKPYIREHSCEVCVKFCCRLSLYKYMAKRFHCIFEWYTWRNHKEVTIFDQGINSFESLSIIDHWNFSIQVFNECGINVNIYSIDRGIMFW